MSPSKLISVIAVSLFSVSIWSQEVVIDTTADGVLMLFLADGRTMSLDNSGSRAEIKVVDTPHVQSLVFRPAEHSMGFGAPDFSWTLLPQAGPAYSGIRYLFSDEQRHFYVNDNNDTLEVVITPGEHKMEIGAELVVDSVEAKNKVKVICPSQPLKGVDLFCTPAKGGVRATDGPDVLDLLLDPESGTVRFEEIPGRSLDVNFGNPQQIDIQINQLGLGPHINRFSGNGVDWIFPPAIPVQELRYLFSDTLHHAWINGSGDTVRVVVTPGEHKMKFDSKVEVRNVIQPDSICMPVYMGTIPFGFTYFTPQPSTGGIKIESESGGSSSGVALDPNGERIILNGDLFTPDAIETEGDLTFNCPSNPFSTGSIQWVGNALEFNASGLTTQQSIKFNPLTDTLCIKTGTVNGVVKIDGNLHITGTKAFQIDHPLDPDNKYLVHSCVEAPERLNIYSGIVITDDHGLAQVQLPGYFNALNIDYRYQLTTIGQSFARTTVWREIDDQGRFIVRTEEPHLKVSWQVTGVRNDKYARENPIQVEVDKFQDR